MTISVVFSISRLLYPKAHPIWFFLYMFFKYYSVRKRQIKYYIKILPDSVLLNIAKKCPKNNCDINNCVLVHPDNVYPNDLILYMCHRKLKTSRKVFVIQSNLCAKNTLYISYTHFHNNIKKQLDFRVKLQKKPIKVNFADEVHLAHICCPIENGSWVGKALQSYFKRPKLIRQGDIVSIDIKHFNESFFTNYELGFTIDTVHFKCMKLIFGDNEVLEEHFCVLKKTDIKQAKKIQNKIPRIHTIGTKSVTTLSDLSPFPYGMDSYVDQLRRAVEPFLAKNKWNLKPAFLIQGAEGCGSDVLISSLALKLGLHYKKIYNSDLAANVYSQNEAKMRAEFFGAQFYAPCILSIHKFENFGKNNESQYDQRIINYFIQSLEERLMDGKYPVVLFCCTSSKDIPIELKRAFLEIFDINAPTSEEREQILKWLLEKNDIALKNIDLKAIANKTNGFYFKDLQTLVHYIEHNLENFTDELGQKYFENAIDFMQSNYSESLGAPKVPQVQWSDIGGLTDVKEEIIKSINLPLKHPDLFKKSRLSRSGILLFGPPGTGKTLLAKAVATECNLCFLAVKGPELLNMYVGQSEQNVRGVFEKAREASPCIIFFDELDSLAPNRGLSGDCGGVMDRIVSQLLAEMDGLNNGEKVFVIGATNRPDLIDPALLRPGRFDKLLYVGPCKDLESKISVLQALTRKFKMSDDVNLCHLVTECPKNISGADFYGVCSEAWSSAAKRLIEKIDKDGLCFEDFNQEDVLVDVKDFKEAFKNVKPSISEDDMIYFENLKQELASNVSVGKI
ncbi:hypothetical protein ABEB36_000748 [Hypothenemus hampei]|uniref:Peroxisomal ATPase PEX6 n=1 Tax=Hypothenemus hampei TaxID=57062 RepID=A0ABD1FCA4_HYPHA